MSVCLQTNMPACWPRVFQSLKGSYKGWVKTNIQRLIASILNCLGDFRESSDVFQKRLCKDNEAFPIPIPLKGPALKKPF